MVSTSIQDPCAIFQAILQKWVNVFLKQKWKLSNVMRVEQVLSCRHVLLREYYSKIVQYIWTKHCIVLGMKLYPFYLGIIETYLFSFHDNNLNQSGQGLFPEHNPNMVQFFWPKLCPAIRLDRDHTLIYCPRSSNELVRFSLQEFLKVISSPFKEFSKTSNFIEN